MGPLISFFMDIVLNRVEIERRFRVDCFNNCRAYMAGDGTGRLQLFFPNVAGVGCQQPRWTGCSCLFILAKHNHDVDLTYSEVCPSHVVPTRARRRLKRPNVDWQRLRTYSTNENSRLYLTSRKSGKGLQNFFHQW